MQRSSITLLLAILVIAPGFGQEHDLAKLPKHLTPVPYAGIRNYHVTQNLGPTGAREWIHGHVIDTHDSREILIKSIEPGSPADGILQPYDVITGAAVPPEGPPASWKTAPEVATFSSDARLSLARAVTWAESDAGQGKLQLLRCRNGETSTVTIPLPVMGTYTETLPIDCPKSQKIVREAAEFVAENMPADGYPASVGRAHNAGLLLATHNPKYLDHVRRSAIRMSELHTISDAGHETWRWGNTNTFLCEYYLATGDGRVLPTIREFCQVLRDGQCNPGTWGHRGVPDYVPPGYGSVNSTGVICFYSIVLANRCGINDADKAIANSIRFYGSYAGRGSLPYGDHPPSYATTSNGKNGAAALAFHMLNADPAAQWFGRLCASSNLQNFEGGHSGNYFNQTWSPLGAQITGEQNYINFWKRFHSYRDLARRADGSFIAQPLPNKREGDLGTGNYVNKGPMWNTGGFALSYLAGTERLAMLGRTDSVFSPNPPAELEPALASFRAKDFAAAAEAVADLTNSDDTRVSKLAAQLEGVAQRNLESIDLTLTDMQKNLESGDLFTAKYQLLGLLSLMEESDPSLKPFQDALAKPEAEEILKRGATYDRGVKGVSWEGEKGFSTIVAQASGAGRRFLEQLARNKDQAYGEMAAAMLAEHPTANLRAGNALATLKAGADAKPNQVASLSASFEVSAPSEIEHLFLTYSLAKALKVELNGTTVLDIKPQAPDTRPVTLMLKPIARDLLKQETNTLTVTFTPSANGFEASLRQEQ